MNTSPYAISKEAPKIGGVAVLYFLILFAAASNFMQWFAGNGGPQAVTYYLAILVLAALAMANRAAQGRPAIPIELIRANRPIVIWIYVWIMYLTVQCLRGLSLPYAMDEFISQFEMALVLAALFLLDSCYASDRRLGVFFAAIIVLSTAMNIYDFILPSFSNVPGRAAGFFLNPNKAGIMITLSLVASVTLLPQRYRMPLLGIAGVGVLLTFSRGAWMALMVSALWLLFSGALGFHRQRWVIGTVALGVAGLLGLGVMTGALVDLLLSTPLAPYLDDNTLTRLGMAEVGTDSSSEARFGIVAHSIATFLEAPNPLLGHGLGYMRGWDYPIGSHNMYMFYLVDGGLLGLAVYLGFLGSAYMLMSGPGRLIVLNLAFFSLFSHNLFHAIDAILFIVLTNRKDFSRDAPPSRRAYLYV